jgi:hypothetical protein
MLGDPVGVVSGKTSPSDALGGRDVRDIARPGQFDELWPNVRLKVPGVDLIEAEHIQYHGACHPLTAATV